MKRLLIFEPGKQPITSQDLTYLQNSYIEVLNQLLSEFHEPNNTQYIISGCEILVAAGTITLSPGVIVIEGEAMEVAAQVIAEPVLPNHVYFTVETTYDPTGTRLFQNGITHETWEVKNAKLVSGAALPSNVLDYNKVPNIHNQIRERLKSNSQPWQEIGSYNSPVGGLYLPGTTLRRYAMIDCDDFVNFDGVMYSEDPALNQVLFNIPAPFRPLTNRKFNIHQLDASNPDASLIIEIQTNGNVIFRSIQYLSIVDLSQIRYRI